MKLIRKCGVLIMHQSIKSKRSGNMHDYWVAFNGTNFSLNWCNGRAMATHGRFNTLKDAIKYFENFIKD